jgi:hypothetical protein
MSRASTKAQTVMLAINPDLLSDAIANKVVSILDAKYGKRLQGDGRRQIERLTDTIDDFATRVGMSRWTIRRDMRRGEIDAIKIGDAVRIPHPEEQARRYLRSRPAFKPTEGARTAENRGPKGKFETAKGQRSPATAPTTGEITESELEARHGRP